MSRVLVACVGNLFLGDDGFGPEVARSLATRGVPSDVEVRDYGIRAMDLWFSLENAERAIVVDVVRRGAAPGTLFVLEPEAGEGDDVPLHPHDATAGHVLAWAARRRARGECPRELRLVGCEAESFGDEDEGRLGLSATVTGAVERAVDLVLEVARDLGGK